jgi:hypothetical protein
MKYQKIAIWRAFLPKTIFSHQHIFYPPCTRGAPPYVILPRISARRKNKVRGPPPSLLHRGLVESRRLVRREGGGGVARRRHIEHEVVDEEVGAGCEVSASCVRRGEEATVAKWKRRLMGNISKARPRRSRCARMARNGGAPWQPRGGRAPGGPAAARRPGPTRAPRLRR